MIYSRGDIIIDKDGSQWRVVSNFANGISRIRVGSLAELIHFPELKK